MKAGGTSSLWPEGVTNIEDLPNDLAVAIDQAIRITHWQENLGADELPPQWMWHLDWELEAWFLDVQKKRNEKYSGGDNSSSNSDTDDSSREWQENAYASRFK